MFLSPTYNKKLGYNKVWPSHQ